MELKSMASDSIDHSYITKSQEKLWTPTQSIFLAGEHTACCKGDASDSTRGWEPCVWSSPSPHPLRLLNNKVIIVSA